ncbi:hypothetical protein [Tabrizicola sp.]|uniref:hypothetical protein n=1 Tax=Tabrizicola sp. TaxID=2005166 RepID=UPI0026283B47|nr:hypothetical protein [Tabrizicola sp.]MDM7931491.1 hypothetical protein [Tabrizicola sp.]
MMAIMSVSGTLEWVADVTVAAQLSDPVKVALLALVALDALAFHPSRSSRKTTQ